MKIVTLINDPKMMQRILRHLGRGSSIPTLAGEESMKSPPNLAGQIEIGSVEAPGEVWRQPRQH